MKRARAVLALILSAAVVGAVPHDEPNQRAAGRFVASRYAYFPGSWIPLRIEGFGAPYDLALVGEGALRGLFYQIPNTASDTVSTLVAGGANGLAMRDFDIAPPPSFDRSMIAVASYDDGVVIHDAANFSPIGVIGIGGAPSGIAIDPSGRIAASDTTGDTYTIASHDPWRVTRRAGVPLGDEMAFDAKTGALFVTDRSLGSSGGLTRVEPDGTTRTIALGLTAEGIAIDPARRRVYVANVNDGTVSIVDADTMREIARFFAVERAFSLALDTRSERLYVVSNQSLTSPFGSAGSVVSVDVSGDHHRIVARSDRLTFPLGAAIDPRTRTVFVTDEHDDSVTVLDATSLREKHAPLPTCETPWEPTVDETSGRLYVPCARADRVDAFYTRSLERVAGAPFATGGYPLAVAVWHPSSEPMRY